MNRLGRKIFFELSTGNVLIDTGEKQGAVKRTTIEEDIAVYKILSERNRNTFDVLELEFGQYAQDFAESIGYRINSDTKQIEFSYPDPNETEPSEPVYQDPLSERVKLLEEYLEEHEAALIEITEMIIGGNV